MELLAEKRDIKGAKVKSLKRKGIIPGVVFSTKSSQGKGDVLNIQLPQLAFKKVYAVAGESALIDLSVGDDKKDVLIKDIQLDPISLLPIHVSFFEVDMSQPIETEIPIILINEDQCEPVTANLGILITLLDRVHVRSLPKNIPASFEVDVSVLKNVEDVLTVKDAIKVDSEKVEILSDPDEALVKVDFKEQLEVADETPASVDDVAVASEEEAAARAEANGEETKGDAPASDDKK